MVTTLEGFLLERKMRSKRKKRKPKTDPYKPVDSFNLASGPPLTGSDGQVHDAPAMPSCEGGV